MSKSKKKIKSKEAVELPKYGKILLIICDQFRFPQHWDSLMGKNGKLSIKDFPNLNRLCSTGREFNNAYIASSACNASRACIYTGKYGRETGVTSTSGFGNEGSHPILRNHDIDFDISWLGLHPSDPQCSLPPDEVIKTLGTHFRLADYRTIYKGKWHLSEVEGEWPDNPYGAEGLEQFGFEGWNPPEGHGNSPLRWGMGADTSYVQDAVNTLYELKDTTDDWFMAVNLINPHDIGFYDDWPMKIPDLGVEVPTSSEEDLIVNHKPEAQEIGKKFWNFSTFGLKGPDPEVWREYCNYYAHLAQIADFNVGIILDALESTGQADDTMVVFLSDHGEMGGSHGMTQKWYQAYEETIHVPLIFSNPNLPSAGVSTDSMASLIDIAPTLLDLAGITLPEGEDVLRGKSLKEIIGTPDVEVQDAVLYVTDDDIVGSAFADLDQNPGTETEKFGRRERKHEIKYLKKLQKVVGGEDVLDAPRHVRAIKNKNNWKLVRYTLEANWENEKSTEVYELYNLNNDPNETHNLAVERGHEKEFNILKSQLDDLLDEKYYHESMRTQESED